MRFSANHHRSIQETCLGLSRRGTEEQNEGAYGNDSQPGPCAEPRVARQHDALSAVIDAITERGCNVAVIDSEGGDRYAIATEHHAFVDVMGRKRPLRGRQSLPDGEVELIACAR